MATARIDIDGNNEDSAFGTLVALNAGRKWNEIRATLDDTTCRVNVYGWSYNTQWTQLGKGIIEGEFIAGEASYHGEIFGDLVAMNADGTRIVGRSPAAD